MLNKTYIDNNGYLRFNNTNKLVHRWIAEKNIGRKLKPDEIVHHKDGNKLNNSPENLYVFSSQKEHQKLHNKKNIQNFFLKLLLPRSIYRLFRLFK
jgi:uncharacterized C2H2 Zn-finger protein